MAKDTDADDATLDGIHSGPLTEAELRWFRREMRDSRRVHWLVATGWKILLGLASFAGMVLAAWNWISDHVSFK